jgi:hypothetical protein
MTDKKKWYHFFINNLRYKAMLKSQKFIIINIPIQDQ